MPRDRQRLRVEIHGAVQGVGFRPYVYRLAGELGLAGWISNDTQGVFIEVEGDTASLVRFLERLPGEAPPRAIVQSLEREWLAPVGYTRFEIRQSDQRGPKTALVLPDIAVCPDCLAEVFDPANRRYRYPFTNCTNCGPRFSIIEALPYDRANTTMRGFAMCPACQHEYADPLNRRFHAQPNACPVCGPQLQLWSHTGATLGEADDALRATAAALLAGKIVAVKGLGGFHLMAAAGDDDAVGALRRRKQRGDKPFALMARDLDQAAGLCDVPDAARRLLISPESPIVLLRARPGAQVSAAVAPGNPNLGVMLPATPLHHLLLRMLGSPLVATSGNLSDEPICSDEHEALERLAGLADLFLVHNRPITRHVDDSIAWVAAGGPRLVRRARGYAPLPVLLPAPVPTVLAVGGHLKNTVALSVGRQVFISQHIGDLETEQALGAFERVIADFLRLYEAQPVALAHDLHPDYVSTQWARAAAATPAADGRALPLVAVQHHHAHLAACLAENGVSGPALGVTWDGTGYGTDGTIWGGEFLLGDAAGYRRVAHLRPFRLPGGDAAVHEPRRSALALLWEMYGPAALQRTDLAPIRDFDPAERHVLGQMLTKGLHSPLTSSAGRLFDGVAALLGLGQRVSFEGQAAMALEFAARLDVDDAYRVRLLPSDRDAGEPLLVDWQPMLEALLEDIGQGAEPAVIAARFHNALVDAIVTVAQIVRQPRVALSGGCFQNRLLLERAGQRLRQAGFEVLLHRETPCNDGAISLGQVAVAAAQLKQDHLGGR